MSNGWHVRAAHQALARDHLEDVAGADVFLCLLDAGEVLLAGHVRFVSQCDFAGRLDVVAGRGGGRTEHLHQGVNALDGVAIGVLRVLPVHTLAADHLDGHVPVVEDEDLVEEHEVDVRQVAVVGRAVRQVLDEAHHVVGHVADGAAGEARQPRHVGQAELRQVAAELVQRVLGGQRALAAVLRDAHDAAAALERGERRGAQDGETADVFGPAGTLQQEAVAVARNLLEREHRGQRVRHELTVDGDHVAPAA